MPTQEEIAKFDVSVESFTTSLALNVALAAIFTVLFLVLRPLLPFVYAPKTSYLLARWRGALKSTVAISTWLPEILVASDKQILESGGFDGFAAFVFCRVAVKSFLVIAVICCAVLLPINLTGKGNSKGMGIFTMANIAESDERRLFAHLLFSFIVNGIMIYTIFSLLHMCVNLHYSQLSESLENSLGRRSILIRDIPRSTLSESQLKSAFEYIGPVEKVVLVKKTAHLNSIVSKLKSIRMSLETGCMVYLRNLIKNDRKMVREGCESKKFHGVDGVDENVEFVSSQSAGMWDATLLRPRRKLGLVFRRKNVDWISDDLMKYVKQLKELEREREEVIASQPDTCAFIVFKSEVAANLALKAVVYESPTAMNDRHLVVDAKNIVWSSLGYTYIYRALVRIAAFIGVTALVVLWAAVVLAVSSLASLDSIYQLFPFLKVVTLSAAARGFLTGFLPTAAVALLLALIPMVLRFVSYAEGEATIAKIERSVLLRHYFFLTFNVLLIVTISKSIWDSLPPILNSPLSTVDILAQSIPPSSVFYMNYVMLQAFTAPTLALLQPGTLILKTISVIGFLKSNTPRTFKMALRPVDWDFPATMALHSLIATIGLTYATISPLVLVFVLLYFMFWTVANFYLIQRVLKKANHTGPHALFTVTMNLFIGIYLSQLTLIGLFTLRDLKILWGLTIFQTAVTVSLHFYAHKYHQLINQVPISVLMKRDMKRQQSCDNLDMSLGSVENTSLQSTAQNRVKKVTMTQVYKKVVIQMGEDVEEIFYDLRTGVIRLWKAAQGVTKGVSESIVNVTGTDFSTTKIKVDDNASNVNIAESSQSGGKVRNDGFDSAGVSSRTGSRDYEMLLHPGMRDKATRPIWLPKYDPLDAVNCLIVPEIRREELEVVQVDARVDSEGHLTLEEGSISLT